MGIFKKNKDEIKIGLSDQSMVITHILHMSEKDLIEGGRPNVLYSQMYTNFNPPPEDDDGNIDWGTIKIDIEMSNNSHLLERRKILIAVDKEIKRRKKE